MSNQDITEWVSKTVAQSILNSGTSKLAVAEKAGIPYATLNRKLKGVGDFSWRELFAIAEVLQLSPTQFTPPIFRERVAAA